jgi:hypothetical protein
MTRELDGGALGKRSSNNVSSPMSWGAASSVRLLGRGVDTHPRCCGRWSNCEQLPGSTACTPISNGELRISCAWLTFLGPSLPPLFFRGRECHNSLKLASAASYWISFSFPDSGSCRPLIPNQGDHRFWCPGKTGRHAIGTGGRHDPEQGDGIHRNRWSAWSGFCTSLKSGPKTRLTLASHSLCTFSPARRLPVLTVFALFRRGPARTLGIACGTLNMTLLAS